MMSTFPSEYTITERLSTQGYAILPAMYTVPQCATIIRLLDQYKSFRPALVPSEQVFAIRKVLQSIPGLAEALLTPEIRQLMCRIAGPQAFLTKSIYFDKPAQANWYVPWHQDLMIHVSGQAELPGYRFWKLREDYYAVQPPADILAQIYTLRIHLDDTDEGNGALYILPGSHRQGILAPKTAAQINTKEVLCPVVQGGVMLMQPLLLHRSSRAHHDRQRRVIHLEFSAQQLPAPLQWSEQLNLM